MVLSSALESTYFAPLVGWAPEQDNVASPLSTTAPPSAGPAHFASVISPLKTWRSCAAAPSAPHSTNANIPLIAFIIRTRAVDIITTSHRWQCTMENSILRRLFFVNSICSFSIPAEDRLDGEAQANFAGSARLKPD